MRIVQPRSSRRLVTLRPASSVWVVEALALARPFPAEEEDELEEETETDEREDARAEALDAPLPLLRCVRTETEPGSATVERSSRPLGRRRVTAQVASPPSVPPWVPAKAAATAAAKVAICGKGIARAPRKALARPALKAAPATFRLSSGASAGLWPSNCRKRRPASRWRRLNCRLRLPSCCSRYPNRRPFPRC